MGNNNIHHHPVSKVNFFTVLQREKAITAIAVVTVKKDKGEF